VLHPLHARLKLDQTETWLDDSLGQRILNKMERRKRFSYVWKCFVMCSRCVGLPQATEPERRLRSDESDLIAERLMSRRCVDAPTASNFVSRRNCDTRLQSDIQRSSKYVFIYNIWGFHGGDCGECRLLGYKNQVRTSQETHYFSTTEPRRLMLCKIWGFHGCEYEECRFLVYKNPVRTSQETLYVYATEPNR
jgi:hypothetical protein